MHLPGVSDMSDMIFSGFRLPPPGGRLYSAGMQRA